MSKKQSKEQEEIQEVTFEEAFDIEPEEVEEVEKETAPEVTDEGEKDKPEKTEEKADEQADEPAAEPEKEESAVEESEPVSEKSWKELGLDRLDGMTKEQIANEIKWINRKYGEHTQEVGKLRKELSDFKVKLEPKKEPEKEQPRKGLTAQEIEDFNTIYQTDPVGAVLKYGGDDIQRLIDQKLEEKLAAKLPETLGKMTKEQVDQFSYEKFVTSHDDYEEYVGAMQTLDAPENLGPQSRPYNELYDLSKLAMTDDSRYQSVYGLMKKHPTLSLKEAMKFTEPNNTKKPVITKEQVVRDVNKLKAINSTSTKNARSEKTAVVGSIDEAFEIDD